jgi:hypothetical protein
VKNRATTLVTEIISTCARSSCSLKRAIENNWPSSKSLLVRGLLLSFLVTGYGQSTFTKITTGPVVTDNADGQGCAWVDIDGDGYLDLYVSCKQTGSNLIYRNDGHGGFSKITTGSIVTSGGGCVGASWADVDNDGRIDLVLSRQNGPSLLFLQQADGSFRRIELNTSSFAYGVALGDYDGNGFVDLLVGDVTQNSLLRNDGQGNFVLEPNSTITTVGYRPSVTWVDLDGYLDAFVTTGGTTGSGVGHFYRNDGHGTFTTVDAGDLSRLASNSTGLAWGDYDNDGYLDVFICRLDNTFQNPLPSMLFHNNGNGTFKQVAPSPFIDDIGYAVSCSWGDYDNDGWLDLIVTNFGNGGANRLYHNNGDGTFSRVYSDAVANDFGNSTGAIWGDYDGDGFLDLFIANATAGSGASNDFLYHNNGNSNSWLTVKCIGTRSNRSAIGTKVRVKATIGGSPVWQLRELNTGDGWSQSALEAHFGLGNATNIEVLRIEWPSGTVQELYNQPTKQYRTIIEPARLTATVNGGKPQILLQAGRGLEFGIQRSSGLTNWSDLGSITITNYDGTALISDTNAPIADRGFYRAWAH